jgi:hypothetical protein
VGEMVRERFNLEKYMVTVRSIAVAGSFNPKR